MIMSLDIVIFGSVMKTLSELLMMMVIMKSMGFIKQKFKLVLLLSVLAREIVYMREYTSGYLHKVGVNVTVYSQL